MPKTKISEFSATPANNTDIDSINLAEGCAPSGINDALRELMAQLKDFQTGAVGDSFNGPVGATTAGTGAFTTLSASSTLGVTGVATLGAGAILNTPASVTLTNATGLPIGTGVSGLGTGVATFLATPSSANLAAALTDETGSGANVFATSPTLVTPLLGTPTSGVATNLTGLPLTTGVTGTLPTANGGTNLTSFTSGGVVYASSTSALATGSGLTFNGSTLSILTANNSPINLSSSSASSTLVQHTNSNASVDLFYRFRQNAGAGNFYDLTMEGSTNAFTIDYNDNERLRIDSSGNVGIGTSSPAAATGFSSSRVVTQITSSSGYGQLRLGGAVGTMIDHDNGGNTATTIRNLYGATSNDAVMLIESGYIVLRTGTSYTERLRIPAAGGVQAVTTISVGNATPSTSGAGITFPATAADSSSANTLDDYEEGTFEPTWTPSTSGTITLYTAYKNLGYTKVGRVVTITGSNTILSVSSPVGTSVNITGLPFAAGATFVHTSATVALDLNTKTGVGIKVGNTATTIEFFVNASTLGTNSDYAFAFSYITAT